MYDTSTFRFLQQNVIVPNPTPLYPAILSGEGADTQIAFNQGYLFDYQNVDPENSTIKKIPISGCAPEEFAAQGKFFVQVLAPEGIVESASVIQTATSDYNFHYSAKNLPDGSTVYLNGEGNYCVPICEFDDLGNLTHHYLRENIHWQKTNYENVGVGEKILYSWGENEAGFNGGSVKFRSLIGVSGITIGPYDGDPETLAIGYDSGYLDDSGSSVDDSGDSKTAILPFKDEFVAFACMEGSEPWFFDIIDVKTDGRNSYVDLPEEILFSCEEGSLEVLSVQGVDKPCKATGSIKEGKLKLKIHNFFAPKMIKVFLYGIRKGHAGKYRRYTEGQYKTNKRFYASAHRG